ncbi:hypothetical protein Dimus_015615 [Dionaea muscipula]
MPTTPSQLIQFSSSSIIGATLQKKITTLNKASPLPSPTTPLPEAKPSCSASYPFHFLFPALLLLLVDEEAERRRRRATRLWVDGRFRWRGWASQAGRPSLLVVDLPLVWATMAGEF